MVVAKSFKVVFKSAGKLGTSIACTLVKCAGIAAAAASAAAFEAVAAALDAAAARTDLLAAIASSLPW